MTTSLPLPRPSTPPGKAPAPPAPTLPGEAAASPVAVAPADSGVSELAARRILSVAEARLSASPGADGRRAVAEGRDAFRRILRGEDSRAVVIAGPCSIHDPDAALEYAARLRALAERVSDRVLVLMRVYFEKPRTHIGWKGLVNDPHLDASHALDDGILLARRLLSEISAMCLPAATEFLDPLVAVYLADLVSWAAIGARTTESQIHRQLASSLPMPVGFKNGTDGGVDIALNALRSAREPHAFLGIDEEGRAGIVRSRGNPDTHVVLRGAGNADRWRANYHREDLDAVEARLAAAGLPSRVLIDCSHANSGYDHRRQALVVDDWLARRRRGEAASAFGVMLESNLEEGRQAFAPRNRLRPGTSVTDACIGWPETESLILRIHDELRP